MAQNSTGPRKSAKPWSSNDTLDTIIVVVLMAVALGVFGQVYGHDFLLYDDNLYITDNPVVLRGLATEGMNYAFFDISKGLWHPLTWLGHMASVQFFGMNPGAHHLVSLAFHLGSTLLLYIFFVYVTGARWRSAFVAFLFAIHPLHVEPVAWLSSLKDTQSTFWLMCAFCCYAVFSRRSSRTFYALTLLFFFAALMAKPMVVTFPILLLLMDYWPLGRWKGLEPDAAEARRDRYSAPWLIVEKVPFFILSLAGGVVAILAARQGGSLKDAEAYPLGVRLANALISYSTYLWKTIVPTEIAAFYPHPGRQVANGLAMASALFLLSVTVIVLLNARRRPWLITGWFWYLVSLAPVSGLLQIGAHGMANRYTYVPLIGIFFMSGWGLQALVQKWPRLRKTVIATVTVWAVALVPLAYYQTYLWRSTQALFERAVVVAPSLLAHVNLGADYLRYNKLHEAEVQFNRALALDSTYPEALSGLGEVYLKQQDYKHAEEYFRAALNQAPYLAETWNSLGVTYAEQGKYEEALGYYQKAIEQRPDSSLTLGNIGVALLVLKRPEDAEAYLRRAVALDPTNETALYNLGVLTLDAGRNEEAMQLIEASLRLQPDDGDAVYHLGVAYERMGRLDAATAHYRRALVLSPGMPEAVKALEALEEDQVAAP